MTRVNLTSAKNPRTWMLLLAFFFAVGMGYFAGKWIIHEMRQGRMPNWFAVHETIVLETGQRTFIEVQGDEPVQGPSDALVTVLVFADFECRACAQAFPPLKAAIERHRETIRVVFKHYPLPRHNRALPAAYAGWAAHRQSKFWEMADALFEGSAHLEELPELISSLGLDGSQFWQDMKSETGHETIDRDRLAGALAQVRGTPTFFVNGHRYLRQWDQETWDAVIEHEAKSARELLDQGIARDKIYQELTAKDQTP